MKIAFFVNQFPILSETFILNQITGLIDRGHAVDIYADRPGDTEKIHSDIEKYSLLECTYYIGRPYNRSRRFLGAIHLLFTNLPKELAVLLQSLNIFKYGRQAASLSLLYATCHFLQKSVDYDIIHCHFAPNGLKVAALMDIGVLQGILITSFHGYDAGKYPQQYGLDIYEQLFQRGDLYTCSSSFLIGKILALGCPDEKVVRLPMGVNISKHLFQERTLDSSGLVKIVTVARLVEKKGIEYSIRALAKVSIDNPNVLYRIIGDGPLRGSLEDLILELNLSEKVKLLGWMTQDEVYELYDDSHIFILPSVTASNGDQEGQGLVLQEAQLMGLPVISTLHNGIPDGVLDGQSGFLVPERDVDALAERLNYLIEHPERWSEMGREGHLFVKRGFDVEKLNDQLVEIYQKLKQVPLDIETLGRKAITG